MARDMFLIARGVILEAIRRKDFYVIAILMGLFVLFSLVSRIGGVKDATTANFILNFGMTAASFFAGVLTITTAARQVPDEIENRTIYPLLAKPVSRETYLLGKWAAACAVGGASYGFFLLLGYLPSPKAEAMTGARALLLAQTIGLQAASLAALSALSLLLSLVLPRPVALAGLVVTYFFGGTIISFIRKRSDSAAVDFATGWLPDFSLLQLTQRFTDNVAPLSALQFAGLLVYAAAIAAVSLGLSMLLFRRRPL
jgi:ABC-type transport system involved in multi-copper enzyme maturation permease subunit